MTRELVLRGGRENNLRGIDLDLPLGRLVVVSGVSGSGKTSLALDTLYTEGQRRYVESFPVWQRQHLPQLERPAAERIENLPPAIAVGQDSAPASGALTVASVAGVAEHLRALFAGHAEARCPNCHHTVTPATVDSVVDELAGLPRPVRLTFAFPLTPADAGKTWSKDLIAEGFVRYEHDGDIGRLEELPKELGTLDRPLRVVVDRVKLDPEDPADAATRGLPNRLAEAVEAALERGDGTMHVQVGDDWLVRTRRLLCPTCGMAFPEPAPGLFSLRNAEATCPHCQGSGADREFRLDRVVAPRKSLRQSAALPLERSSYRPRKADLAADAGQAGLPVADPLNRWTDEQRGRLWHGGDGFQGLRERLEKLLAKAKGADRRFLDAFRTEVPCPHCDGDRFRPEVRALRVAGRSYGDVLRSTAEELSAEWVTELPADAEVVRQLAQRLRTMADVGLGSLQPGRMLDTVSAGERQRTALVSALGSGLAQTLFVLDEPTAGLHAADTEKLLAAIRTLQGDDNTVLVVEHDLDVIRMADFVVDVGPDAGKAGGRIVYAGPPAGLAEVEESYTAGYLAEPLAPKARPARPAAFAKVRGARMHNLRGIDVDVPLGCLCVVTGVSGAGKSSLVMDTLHPLAAEATTGEPVSDPRCRRLESLPHVEAVEAVGEQPLGRSGRGNALTMLKVFDEVRRIYAGTLEARTRGLTASDFSFNTAGGRCERCQGTGTVVTDMQFLPDVRLRCPECGGRRYDAAVLAVKHRGLGIDELLALPAAAAYDLFRKAPKVQRALHALVQVGLDYLPLGQPLDTLSGGEARRLKLASFLGVTGKRHLFLFDEPTIGLHPADVGTLLDCLAGLIEQGHSVVAADHDPVLLAGADWLIELGPGAAAEGGQVIFAGTPAELATRDTPTGRLLARSFAAR